MWRAAQLLGIDVHAAAPAVEAGLVEFGARVRFRHPLARSAAYRSAPFPERQRLHAALAQVTDPQVDPDRRAWHRAAGAAGPDEEVAAELEQPPAGRRRAVAWPRRRHSWSGQCTSPPIRRGAPNAR